MSLNSLVAAASFSPRSLQPPNAWIGHLPFAAWVVREVAPKILVELGTHSGNSYFSFCQSVAEAGLATKCFAVDTWRGDEHAGHYDESVWVRVNAHNEECYTGFSRLLRLTFDDAVGYFADESVNLLHIDGLHTYEAVRHDFETWLPKLAPGAIVMFHDTNVRERGFGVWKLWEELVSRYSNNLEFVHSHGLGVLQLDNAKHGNKQKWLQPNEVEKQGLKTYFAALGSRQLERFELLELGQWRQHAANLTAEVSARDIRITDLTQHTSNLTAEVSARDIRIADLTQHAANLTAEVSARDIRIADLTQHASNLTAEVSARESRITELTQHAANLTMEISARNSQIADLKQLASGLSLELSARDTHIVSLNQGLAERDDQIMSLRQDARERESVIAELKQLAAAREALVASLNRGAAERDDRISSLAHEVHSLRHSTSWRITSPLRWLVLRAKGVGLL